MHQFYRKGWYLAIWNLRGKCMYLHVNLRPCVHTRSNGWSIVLQANIVILVKMEVFDAQEL